MPSEKFSIIGSDWPNKLSYAKRKKRTGVKKVRSGRESIAGPFAYESRTHTVAPPLLP